MGAKQVKLGGDMGIFCELAHHAIERIIETNNMWNMDETGLDQKKKSCKLIASKGLINVRSNYFEENFHMNFVVCITLRVLIPHYN